MLAWRAESLLVTEVIFKKHHAGTLPSSGGGVLKGDLRQEASLEARKQAVREGGALNFGLRGMR